VHAWTDEKCREEFTVQAKKQKTVQSESGSAAAADFFQKRRVTQKEVDRAVDEFVICTRQPHRIVDNVYFKRIALLGLPSSLTISCRQTFRKRLDQHFATMQTNLIKEMREIQYVATAADGWSKFRRGFLGMIATWLNPQTLQRELAGLALQRLKGRHTHERLASSMDKVYATYELKDGKVVKCTTDSAANYVKAFKVYSVTSSQSNEGK
jgi:hypothetical protein